MGEYQEDVGAADEECKRWDRAYPVVFKDDLLGATELGIQVEFQTFACVSAITLNVYDALDPEGMSAVPDRLETNGPSPNAQGYEDRQSVSLADVQDMGTVDMVTITIGGNDASFSTILEKCVTPYYQNIDSTCNESDLEDCEIAVNQNNVAPCDGDGGVGPLSYREVIESIEERVVEVLGRIKNDAPRASVFLLGYPYLTPVLTPALEPCDGLTRREIASLNRDYEDRRDFDTTGLSDRCVYRLVVYFESFLDCESLEATETAHAVSGPKTPFADLGGWFQHGKVKVDPGEALFLLGAAAGLNAALIKAAWRAGVHFVDVVGGVESSRHPGGFVGHDPCSGADAWLNGFVVDDEESDGSSGKTFHPTPAGHVGYAEILWQYIFNKSMDPQVRLTCRPIRPLYGQEKAAG